MHRIIMRFLRVIRDLIASFGIQIRTIRGDRQWRAGIEILWHSFARETERVKICRVEYVEKSVAFLVRNSDDAIQKNFLQGRFYAEDELNKIRENYTGGTFLDVGANVGNHSLFAAIIMGAPKVIAIEPNPNSYQILRCNIALNDLNSVIEHFPIGLSCYDGRGALESEEENNLGHTVIRNMDNGSIDLRAGDDLFRSEEIGFVKIDVEGMELDVLRGLHATIHRCRPPLMVEVDDTNSLEFFELIKNIGYDIESKSKVYKNNCYYLILPNQDIAQKIF